jgi:hypothetical protein
MHSGQWNRPLATLVNKSDSLQTHMQTFQWRLSDGAKQKSILPFLAPPDVLLHGHQELGNGYVLL